ncbi:MAG TPA: bifunctional phosphopantothenoylcysteine decarboxylase/phosphopantothenate--cysteine ligase CoaBC [Blastocatellia bacterium]|nr:bifunctional phosphopantothenoylcysteine decarboxylase/phosphopantothenate--cysteine ligase CoaBC [Blastocatellia bacterium]
MIVGLGVTGCIAAYKAVEVLRGLQKRGATVRVMMTHHATELVGPLTFQSISGLPVIIEMFAPTDDPEIKHIQIAQEIDLLLVAPATANTLAKFANGIADDFLSTLYISTTAPVLVAPAMNVEMWAHPATRENVRRLRERGVEFIDPGEGYLACRTVGAGRLAEPDEIVARAWEMLNEPVDRRGGSSSRSGSSATPMTGERVLITAGPTYEAIDPVRGITNRSSGKMGYALAEAALARGAEVTLVTGPVALAPPEGARVISVRSASEMFNAVMGNLEAATMVLMSAAVADYRPAHPAAQKIKKGNNGMVVELEQTDDILAATGLKKDSRVIVGFAAETENVVANARKKLLEKSADLIVANDVSAADAGFDVDTNRVTLVSVEESIELPLLSKRAAADAIVEAAIKIKHTRDQQ